MHFSTMATYGTGSYSPTRTYLVDELCDSENIFVLSDLFIHEAVGLYGRHGSSPGAFVTACVYIITDNAYSHGFSECKFTQRIGRKDIIIHLFLRTSRLIKTLID